MIFGPALSPAPSTQCADWIAGTLSGNGTVASLVPSQYETFLQVESPAPQIDEWWNEYRQIFRLIAAIGARWTETPDLAWYAVWEGHGFGGGATGFYSLPGTVRDPAYDAAEQARFDAQNRATLSALSELPQFALPHRRYYLLGGRVSAAAELVWPGEPARWFRPDLWWPDDRSWFVATDVDFWRLYVGGTADFTTEVASSVPTVAQQVRLDRVLEAEN